MDSPTYKKALDVLHWRRRCNQDEAQDELVPALLISRALHTKMLTEMEPEMYYFSPTGYLILEGHFVVIRVTMQGMCAINMPIENANELGGFR